MVDADVSAVTVLGAGVVGSVYAALLARAGHDVTLVARGDRLRQVQAHGVDVVLDGEAIVARVAAVERLADADGDVLLVCVRGDQLADALKDVADCPAASVLVFANPLDMRRVVEDRVGRDRLVWCFSGVGGELVAGRIDAHRVAQQATVVETGQDASATAAELLAPIDPRLRREPRMADWLDTHTVFVAAVAAVILERDPRTAAERWSAATALVDAMREAFAALESRGTTVTPPNLRMIFGRVPRPFAAAYWARQFTRPVVTVSMAPHARATRHTEQRQVADRALALAGDRASRYRSLVASMSAPAGTTPPGAVTPCSPTTARPTEGGR